MMLDFNAFVIAIVMMCTCNIDGKSFGVVSSLPWRLCSVVRWRVQFPASTDIIVFTSSSSASSSSLFQATVQDLFR